MNRRSICMLVGIWLGWALVLVAYDDPAVRAIPSNYTWEVEPCTPPAWDGFTARRRFRGRVCLLESGQPKLSPARRTAWQIDI